MREKRYRCFIQLYRFFLVLFDNSLRFLSEKENVLKMRNFLVFRGMIVKID